MLWWMFEFLVQHSFYDFDCTCGPRVEPCQANLVLTSVQVGDSFCTISRATGRNHASLRLSDAMAMLRGPKLEIKRCLAHILGMWSERLIAYLSSSKKCPLCAPVIVVYYASLS